MAGRGRGRGRGEPLTGAKAFLLQSEQEYGIDRNRAPPPLFPPIHLHSTGDNNLLRLMKRQEAERQKMVRDGIVDPAREKALKEEEAAIKALNSNQQSGGGGGRKSQQTVYLIQKGREMAYRMESSASYVRPTKYVPDVIRSSDATRPPPRIDASAVLSTCLEGRVETVRGRFVPEELVSGQVLLAGQAADMRGQAGKPLSMEELKARMRKNRPEGEGEGEGSDGENAEGAEYDQEVEEELEGEDYGVNHYDSEGYDSDDGDGEPTY